jgi:hypothetical protein
MTIMLDPRYKVLCIVQSLVGCRNAIKLTFKYDAKIMISLLMVCFEWLNPNIVTSTKLIDDVGLELEQNMFRTGALIEESFWALVIRELSLFRKLFISSSTCAYSLTWWHMHEGLFPNVGFFYKIDFWNLGFINKN